MHIREYILERSVPTSTISKNLPEEQYFTIWQQYKNAMERRRPGSVLSLDRFVNHLLNNSYIFQYNDSYILGQFYRGLFVPSHFAPKNIREGYEALKELKQYDNVAFAVTKDLEPMLKKLGYRSLPLSITRQFRGDDVEKSLLVSSLFGSLKNILKQEEEEEPSPYKDFNLPSRFHDNTLYVRVSKPIFREILNIDYYERKNKQNLIKSKLELLFKKRINFDLWDVSITPLNYHKHRDYILQITIEDPRAFKYFYNAPAYTTSFEIIEN